VAQGAADRGEPFVPLRDRFRSSSGPFFVAWSRIDMRINIHTHHTPPWMVANPARISEQEPCCSLLITPDPINRRNKRSATPERMIEDSVHPLRRRSAHGGRKALDEVQRCLDGGMQGIGECGIPWQDSPGSLLGAHCPGRRDARLRFSSSAQVAPGAERSDSRNWNRPCRILVAFRV
jgi:hypothetical protein